MDVVDALPNLEEVVIDVASIREQVEDKDIDNVVGYPEPRVPGRHLRSLMIGQATIEGDNPCLTLYHLLHSISSVKFLKIAGLSSSADDTSVITIRNFAKKLYSSTNWHLDVEKLEWEYECDSGLFLVEMCRKSSPCKLRHLDFKYYDDPESDNRTAVAQEFLNDVGGGLESLSIALTGIQRTYPHCDSNYTLARFIRISCLRSTGTEYFLLSRLRPRHIPLHLTPIPQLHTRHLPPRRTILSNLFPIHPRLPLNRSPHPTQTHNQVRILLHLRNLPIHLQSLIPRLGTIHEDPQLASLSNEKNNIGDLGVDEL